MANNIIGHLDTNFVLSVTCSHPATPQSGDPVRWGELTGISLTDEDAGGNLTGMTTVDFGWKEANLSVAGIDAGGNSAVAEGDKIYYVDADSPPLSKKATGRFFGYANGTVTSGATATIAVVHVPAG